MKRKPAATTAAQHRHLLIRYGGLGDSIFLTCVAHQLRKHGIIPDLAIPAAHVPIIENNPDVGRVIALHRVGPWNMSATGPVNQYRDKDGQLKVIENILPEYQTGPRHRRLRVTDYYRIIEANGCHPSSNTGNSDYTNTYDLHLSWAGVDPALVPSREKRPFYYPTEKELDWATAVFKDVPRPIILWQPHASAPARCYYRGTETAIAVQKKVGGYHLMWEPSRNAWMHSTGAIDCTGINPLRATAALIAVADLLISADTFVSHLSEAVGTKHLTFYSTVSAWTRSQYYEHEFTYDLHPAYANPAMPCKCHVITDARCPLIEAEAIMAIPERDRALINGIHPQNRQQIGLPTEQLPVAHGVEARKDIHPNMMEAYVHSLANNYNVSRHAEPYCIREFDLKAAALDAIQQVQDERKGKR